MHHVHVFSTMHRSVEKFMVMIVDDMMVFVIRGVMISHISLMVVDDWIHGRSLHEIVMHQSMLVIV